MYLRTVLLLLGVFAIASVQGKRKPVVLRINRPLEKDKSTKPLTLDCSFINSMTKMRTVNSLTILRSETGKEANYTPIATVTPNSKTSNLGDSKLTVSGKITEGGESTVLAQYAEPNTGYCFFYKCVVEGTDKSGSFRTYNRKRRDRCGKKKRNPSSDAAERSKTGTEEKESKVLTKSIDLGTLGRARKIPPTPASQLDSIDRTKYIVSTAYKGTVYILSNTDAVFDIEISGTKCVENNGYLVEIDDKDEEVFVGTLAHNKAPGKLVYTGATDWMTEGSFFQSYSQIPLSSDLIWAHSQPDNYGGDQDCVTVAGNGLSDNGCARTGRFICEIPLK